MVEAIHTILCHVSCSVYCTLVCQCRQSCCHKEWQTNSSTLSTKSSVDQEVPRRANVWICCSSFDIIASGFNFPFPANALIVSQHEKLCKPTKASMNVLVEQSVLLTESDMNCFTPLMLIICLKILVPVFIHKLSCICSQKHQYQMTSSKLMLACWARNSIRVSASSWFDCSWPTFIQSTDDKLKHSFSQVT